jgi:hypothetical protein
LHDKQEIQKEKQIKLCLSTEISAVNMAIKSDNESKGKKEK